MQSPVMYQQLSGYQTGHVASHSHWMMTMVGRLVVL